MTIIHIDFTRPKELEPVFTIEDSRPEDIFCYQHTKIWIDEHTRVLTCQKCGKVIDPYVYVLLWANKETALFSNIKQLTFEQNRLEQSNEKLKKEAQALKSQIKRAKESLGKLENAVVSKNKTQDLFNKPTAKACLSEIRETLK
jgi:outer membrane murein-binding lipoprotein Lpp